jgi:hypothetical protein
MEIPFALFFGVGHQSGANIMIAWSEVRRGIWRIQVLLVPWFEDHIAEDKETTQNKISAVIKKTLINWCFLKH